MTAGGSLARLRRVLRQAVARDLERDSCARERRPQLVADRTEELALTAHHGLDPVGHPVEADRDVAHLLSDPPATPAGQVGANREVAPAEPVGELG